MGVELFAARAGQEGIPFRHLVRPDSVGHAVRELEEEIGRVHFVLGEAEATQGLRMEASIPVYSLVE